MTRKDYQLIAEAIKSGGYKMTNGENDKFLNALTTALKQDNERFDTKRFLDACGY